MATNEEVLAPKFLIIPTVTPANSQTGAPIGTLCMSGAMLCFASAIGVFTPVA